MDFLDSFHSSPTSTFWDLLLRATFWNIWIERNNRIFNLHAHSLLYVIAKITHMLLSWIFAARDLTHCSHEDSTRTLRGSLDFLSARPECLTGATTTHTSQEWYVSLISLKRPRIPDGGLRFLSYIFFLLFSAFLCWLF